ncbi:unnamed protein product [Chironomus riparius]|uniref:Uncharacterized protein n=1 Tax=Chironomus riparius TaxID=315576 RepID=A0A9N9RMZ3_9DIPT|nr:unnamed protein product [Chironomus riparius]
MIMATKKKKSNKQTEFASSFLLRAQWMGGHIQLVLSK